MFLVNNHKGIDTDIYEVGLITTGDDLRLTLRRMGGRYSLVVDNLTRNSSSTLEIPHPAFLDQENDLHVGLFGANTQSDLRKTLTIRELKVTVWTTQAENPTIAQSRVRRLNCSQARGRQQAFTAASGWSRPRLRYALCTTLRFSPMKRMLHFAVFLGLALAIDARGAEPARRRCRHAPAPRDQGVVPG